MPSKPIPAPEVRAARPERTPSVWHPEPIPTPGIGRSTEDPRTPTLKELALREVRRASLLAAEPAGAEAVVLADAPAPLDCDAVWREARARTQAVLARGGDANPIERNRHISAAYARLYQQRPDMTWAGLAAITSAQAGCAMRETGDLDHLEGVERTPTVVVPGDPRSAGTGLGTAVLGSVGRHAAIIGRGTADTNELIFEDIYPAMSVYQQHGLAAVTGENGGCGGPARAGEDPRVPPTLQQAFRYIGAGRPRAGADAIAEYEQTMVQDRLYNRRPELVASMQYVQQMADTPVVGWAGGLLFGLRKPEIPLSAECTTRGAIPFDGDITVAQARIKYYSKLMDAMERQRRLDPSRLHGTLQTIADRGR